MTITKRGNSFQVSYGSADGRVRKLFPTEEEAKRFEEQLIKGDDANSIGYLFPLWAEKLYAGTKNKRMGLINTALLVKAIGPRTLVSAINLDTVEALTETFVDIGNKPGTINRKLAALSKMLGYAFKKKLITEKPAIEMQADPLNGRLTILSYEDEPRLLAELPDENPARMFRTYAAFLLYTACRPSEALKLEWKDVDWDEVAVTFWDTKTAGVRTIPLADEALASLKRTKALGWDRPFQWVNYENFYRTFLRARDRLEIDPKLVPYCLRHTCATRLGKGNLKEGIPGMDVIRLMVWLGHSSPIMTKRYTHHAVDSLRAGADLLSSRKKAA